MGPSVKIRSAFTRLLSLCLAAIFLISCHPGTPTETGGSTTPTPTDPADPTAGETAGATEALPTDPTAGPVPTEPIAPTDPVPTVPQATKPPATAPSVPAPPATVPTPTEPPATQPPSNEPVLTMPEVADPPAPVLHFDFNDPWGSTFLSSDGRIRGTCYNLTVQDAYEGKGLYTTYKKRCGFSFGQNTVADLTPDRVFTVSMWLRMEDNQGRNLRILSLYDENGEYLGLYCSNRHLYLWLTDHRTHTKYTYTFPYTLAYGGNDEIWQFVTLSVDRNTNEVNAFANGRQLTTRQDSTTGNVATSAQQADTLGGDGAKSASNMTGLIDNFYLHDQLLTPAEVWGLYLSQPNTEYSYDTLTFSEKINVFLKCLGNGAVLKAGTGNIIHQGYVVKADTENYDADNILIGGTLYTPASFAVRYFGATLSGSRCTVRGTTLTGTTRSGILYFSVPDLCRAAGLSTIDLTAEEHQLFVICASDTRLSSAQDRALIETMNDFCTEHDNEPTINVEQTREVIMYSDKSTEEWVYSPSIIKVGDILYSSMDASDGLYTAIYRSLDEGETWELLSRIEKYYWWASLFKANGMLYLFGTYSTEWVHSNSRTTRYYIGITRSTDGGYTWERMSEGNGLITYLTTSSMPHRAPTACLRNDGKIYFVFEHDSLPVLCWAQERSDLMLAENWHFAPFADPPADVSYAIEGNPVLGPDGRIYVLSRSNTADTAYLTVLNEAGTALEAVGYLSMDGGSHKFTVRYDEKTGKYLSISNYTGGDPAIKQQRLYLVLLSSDDLVHWTLEEILLSDRQVLDWYTAVYQNGFQYVDWIIDGDDILMAVREARENAKNYHDANYLTFYRLENYAQYIG
ncbi:MAG: hypothetical protein E7436_00040 [Ruminococcaceae bacterium]|nr:hypothetical protein [Oscillospiraceae bacterium]